MVAVSHPMDGSLSLPLCRKNFAEENYFLTVLFIYLAVVVCLFIQNCVIGISRESSRIKLALNPNP